MKITRYEKMEGEILPPWYYGLAYYQWEADIAIFYPIPLNYFVKIGITINHIWNKFRSRPSWFDKQIMKARGDITRYWLDRIEQERTEQAKYEHIRYGPIFKREGNGFIFSHIGSMTDKEVQVCDEAIAFLSKNLNNAFEKGKQNERSTKRQ